MIRSIESSPAASVDVWRVDLLRSARELAQLVRYLDATERAEAAGVATSDRRRRYVATRGALRSILGAYLGMPSRDVRLVRRACISCGEPHGKPALAEADAVRFNVAHAGEIALVAVATGCEIGVDVEEAEFAGARLAEFAGEFLAPAELDAWRRLDAPHQRKFCSETWVRKEAVLKAVGCGLAIDPTAVLVGADGEAQVEWRGKVYTVAPVPAEPGYIAAVAIEGDRIDATSRVHAWSAPRVGARGSEPEPPNKQPD